MNASENRRVRVAVLSTHPIQYQAPLWRRLATDPRLDLRVFFGTDMSVRGYRDEGFGVNVRWDTPLLEGYASEFNSTDPSITRVSFQSPDGRGLHARLERFKPDVALLTAYRSRFLLAGGRAARSLGARIVMRHEASDVAFDRSTLKSVIRDLLLRQLYARVDGFACIGVEAKRHLTRLGVPSERIRFSPYCIDSDHFERESAKWHPRRNALRQELGIAPDDVALVFSGKLIPKKDPLLVLRALRLLPAEIQSRCHWIIAGDGELRPAVLKEGRSMGPRLHPLGFLNQRDVGRAYAASDALVLPSKEGGGETWGLVVNEAMQFGLPCLVSTGVGCKLDLVEEGRTGWVFKAEDPGSLAGAILKLTTLRRTGGETLAKRARSKAAAYSTSVAAEGLTQALLASVGTDAAGIATSDSAGELPMKGTS